MKLAGITHPFDQVLCLWTDKIRNCHFSSCNPPLGHHRCVLKWCLSNQELIRQNTQAPQVDLVRIVVIMVSRLDHLRWEIIQSSTHCLSPVVRCVDTPSEIRYLDFAVYPHKDIFRLDISVDDMLLVEVLQSCSHLCNILSSFPFWKSVLASKVLVQFSLSSELENQEYPLAVMEVSVEL